MVMEHSVLSRHKDLLVNVQKVLLETHLLEGLVNQIYARARVLVLRPTCA